MLYNLLMPKLRVTKKWKIAGITVLVVVLLCIVINYVIVPKIRSLVLSQAPGVSDVQRALKVQFPQEKFGFSEQSTSYNGSEQRVLVVNLVGKTYLNTSQLSSAQTILCSALGQNARKYSTIYLQTTASHQFLVFYYSTSLEPNLVSCN